MKYKKKKLIALAQKIEQEQQVTPEEISYFINFEREDKDNKIIKVLKKIAVPASLILGFFFAAFPEFFEQQAKHLPSWTNLSPPLLNGVNYLWNILTEPVEQPNIIYHIPHIILYSFGILGIKKLIDAIDHRTWLDKVLQAKTKLQQNMNLGTINLKMKNGHSLLFVGKGDFIGTQFVLNHNIDETVTISELKPAYTQIWNHYSIDTLYEDLKNVITRSNGDNAGEYVFFPVKDDQIFLPNEKAYDLSPHKLDILCQNIRIIEKEQNWSNKRIIIIGDKFHKSFVRSEDQEKVIDKSEDTISLDSIAKKYTNVTLLDPSDIVLKKILEIAQNRKIVFRATKEGIAEYKQRFYERLHLLGYNPQGEENGILTIGYDLFEDQTEQQTLARKIDDYYPVVLSKNVRDALIRNGYKENEFLYVPEIVLQTLSLVAAEQ
jgi:hypothetical protein